MTAYHEPVLMAETLEALAVDPAGTYVDCTAGGGGHSAAILERLTTGRLLALDRDPEAIAEASARLAAVPTEARWQLVRRPFAELDAALSEAGLERGSVHGILADVGVSSHQLDAPMRGFSFKQDGPLDMRMDPTGGPSAADLVGGWSERDLAALFRRHDEPRARAIASAIVRAREEEPIQTTAQLAAVVHRAARAGQRKDPATRVFQALRVEVNGEEQQLLALLERALPWLCPGGRLAVITFHSGEDRPVKQRFALLARDCVCDPKPPVCRCGWHPQVRLPRRNGWTAGPAELARNPRARSARLRVAVRNDLPLLPLPS